eukprot:1142810-Pelagomonas_calceolata.AAC.7
MSLPHQRACLPRGELGCRQSMSLTLQDLQHTRAIAAAVAAASRLQGIYERGNNKICLVTSPFPYLAVQIRSRREE